MEKQKELEELKKEYESLINKLEEVETLLDDCKEEDAVEVFECNLLEDQYSAMRLYAKALYDRILFVENIAAPQECKCKKSEKKNTKKETHTIDLSKNTDLSIKQISEIFDNLCKAASKNEDTDLTVEFYVK